MMYAMPVIKTAADRAALRKAATSGDACYFLGTDSAPHQFVRKVAISAVPGIFNAPLRFRLMPRSSKKKVHSISSSVYFAQRPKALSLAAERG